MIKLTLNGQMAALFPDTEIGITTMNPYFNEIGAFSYPFTIPYIPNQVILQHAARIQNVPSSFIWDAVLYVDGILILSGEAIAEGDVEDGAFPIILRSKQTSFAVLADTKNLQELEWGIEPNGSSYDDVVAKRTATLSGCYPDYNYICAPLYNEEAWNEKEQRDKIANYINKYNPVTELLQDVVNNDGNKANVITYNFYVRYILKRIIELFGYVLSSDEMAEIPDLNKWFMLSLNNMWGYFENNYKRAFPEVVVRDFLKLIRQFGIVIVLNEQHKEAHIKLVKNIFKSDKTNNLLSLGALTDVIVMSTPVTGYTYEYSEASDDYMLKNIEGYSPVVNTYSDLETPGRSTVGYSCFVTETGLYYITILEDKADDKDPDTYTWQELGTYRPYISGTNGTSNQIDVTVIPQRNETIRVTKSIWINTGNPPIPEQVTQTFDIKIEMPHLAQKMNDYYQIWYNGSKYEDWPVVLLFNWGLKVFTSEDSRIAVKYPVISGDAYDRDGNSKGTISMRTHGEKSIIWQLVKDEQDWIVRRKSKRQFFRLSIADYVNFNWADKQNIDSVNYLVNSLKYDITSKGISIIEAELFTV